METSIEELIHQLDRSGLLKLEALKAFLPPNANPTDANELANELVRNHRLTAFQAEKAMQGKIESLILGNYVLLEKVGAGGMGQVFKAEHRRMKRLVALKFLPEALTKDQVAIARFEREIEIAAKISHPNVVTAYDADHADGIHFLVMEYIDGSDLAGLVKKHGVLPLETSIEYILQAALGLQAAHTREIIHRDVKPSNLLLDSKGTVKVLDLGLARARISTNASTQAELTETGMVMGTVDYMAPEQAVSTRDVDERSDMYSLGCTLFYLVNGRPMFEEETLFARIIAHREKPAPPLSERIYANSKQIEAVFAKMVAKTPDCRYQTMGELINELVTVKRTFVRDDSKALIPSSECTSPYTGHPAINGNLPVKPRIVPNGRPTKLPLRKYLVLLLLMCSGLVGTALYFGFTNSGTTVTEDANKPWTRAEFQRWAKSVSAMTPDKQLSAVSSKLKELNPGFDGLLSPTRQMDGPITGLSITTDSISNISPVIAFPELRSLLCVGSSPSKGVLLDLSPLEGMKLDFLDCGWSQLSDLSPLRGMPLIHFKANRSNVSDISPLFECEHLRTLEIKGTRVTAEAVEALKKKNPSCVIVWP